LKKQKVTASFSAVEEEEEERKRKRRKKKTKNKIVRDGLLYNRYRNGRNKGSRQCVELWIITRGVYLASHP
jgi:hypothetical protein